MTASNWRQWIGIFVVSCIAAAPLYAQTSNDKDSKPTTDERPASATISSEEEEEVLEFVTTHNAPLRSLLADLKAARPAEYQRALVDLLRTTQRLAQVKRNRPHAYALEIERWKTQSRVQILTALLALRGDAKIREELKEALQQRADVQLRILKADREAAARRLAELDEKIRQAEEGREAKVQQEFDRAVTAARRARGARTDGQRRRPAAGSADADAKLKDADVGKSPPK